MDETNDSAATAMISSLLEGRPTPSMDDLKGKITGRAGRWQSMDIFNLASSKSEIPHIETSSWQTLTGY